MDTQSAIEQATLAFYLGNKAQARALLKAALNQEPRNEQAWLLYAEVAEKAEYAVNCYEQILKFNPESKAAQKGLVRLRSANVSDIPRPNPTPPKTAESERPRAKTKSDLPNTRIDLDAEERKLEKRYGGLRFIVFLINLLAVLTLLAGLCGAYNVFQISVANSRASVATYNYIMSTLEPNAPPRALPQPETEAFGYGVAVAIALAGLVGAIAIVAFAQLTRLFIDMEYNTRLSAQLLKDIASKPNKGAG